MATKHKQDFLYQPDTPIVYKLWKGVMVDSSIVKENLIRKDSEDGNTTSTLNGARALTFKYSDSISFLNLASTQSGFVVCIRFKTQYKPVGSQADADPWVDREQANITLANSWFSHLFDSAKLTLGSTEIETINHFGTLFETLGHLRGLEYRERVGINESIFPDTGEGNATNNGFNIRKALYNYDVPADADYREVQAFIPLHSIFGFCQDYNRVIRNIPIQIKLNRNKDYKNCVLGADHTNVVLELTGLVLQIEQLIPSDTALVAINDFITKTDTIDIHFRAKACDIFTDKDGTGIKFSLTGYSNPRYIIIGCKDPAKKDKVQENFGKLENGNIKNIKVTIGAQEYPNEQQDAEFKLNKYTHFYTPLVNMCRELYKNECAISMKDFKDLYTIFVIDTSNQPAKATNEEVNIKVEITRRDVVGIAKLEYYAIVIYERGFKMYLKEGRIRELT